MDHGLSGVSVTTMDSFGFEFILTAEMMHSEIMLSISDAIPTKIVIYGLLLYT